MKTLLKWTLGTLLLFILISLESNRIQQAEQIKEQTDRIGKQEEKLEEQAKKLNAIKLVVDNYLGN